MKEMLCCTRECFDRELLTVIVIIFSCVSFFSMEKGRAKQQQKK